MILTVLSTLRGLLNKLGFPCAIDGDFGQDTAVKVKAYQKKNGLKSDAIVGGKTIDTMFSTRSLVLKRTNKGTDVAVL